MPTGPQLRVARVARGLTLAHVSQAVGVSVATLSRIEHGRAPLHDDVRERLMHTVGWTEAFDRLFEDLQATGPGPDPHTECNGDEPQPVVLSEAGPSASSG